VQINRPKSSAAKFVCPIYPTSLNGGYSRNGDRPPVIFDLPSTGGPHDPRRASQSYFTSRENFNLAMCIGCIMGLIISLVLFFIFP
jgi:hypothetical protein